MQASLVKKAQQMSDPRSIPVRSNLQQANVTKVPRRGITECCPWRTRQDSAKSVDKTLSTGLEGAVSGYHLRKMKLSTEEAEARLKDLSTIIPLSGTSLRAYRQQTLADLLRDPPSVSQQIARLKEALPLLDLSVALQLFPALLLKDVELGVRLVQVLAWKRNLSFEAAQHFINKQATSAAFVMEMEESFPALRSHSITDKLYPEESQSIFHLI